MSSRILSRLRSSAGSDPMRHLNQAERAVRLDYLVRKPLSTPPVPYNPFSRVPCQPHIYSVQSQKWVPLKNTVSGAMDPGGVLKVVSWNLYHPGPHPGSRASAALDHLRELFGDAPGPLAVMLQELCDHSFRSIKENKWVQRNFVLSDINPPLSIYNETPGETFILRQLQWRAAPYFTMIMTPYPDQDPMQRSHEEHQEL